jgi:hypothetical protein
MPADSAGKNFPTFLNRTGSDEQTTSPTSTNLENAIRPKSSTGLIISDSISSTVTLDRAASGPTISRTFVYEKRLLQRLQAFHRPLVRAKGQRVYRASQM